MLNLLIFLLPHCWCVVGTMLLMITQWLAWLAPQVLSTSQAEAELEQEEAQGRPRVLGRDH